MADPNQTATTAAILLVCDKCGGLVMGRSKTLKKCQCPDTERVTSETTEATQGTTTKR